MGIIAQPSPPRPDAKESETLGETLWQRRGVIRLDRFGFLSGKFVEKMEDFNRFNKKW